MELSPVVDIPVSVNIEWTAPDGRTAHEVAHPSTEGLNRTFISTVVASSFGKQSGVYRCTATVSSTLVLITASDSTSGSINASVGMLLCGPQ